MKFLESAEVVVSESRMEIKNSFVRRVLEKSAGVWRTVAVSRADGSDPIELQSEEFMILLLDGRKLGLEDYQTQGAASVLKEGETSVVEINYVPRGTPEPGMPERVSVSYILGNEPYLRKSLTLTMHEGQSVDRLEVERIKSQMVCDLGGIGEPILMGDSWFAGLEYPGSHAEHCGGMVVLAHYPGRAKVDSQGDWSIQSKTAVLGTGAPGDPVDVAFHDYIESIRLPAPKHLLINTWSSSFRNPGSADRLLDFYDLYDRNLRPYGVKIDSLQPDLMGWQPGTLSHPRKDIFPNGYKPLSQGLKARGACLSLWLALNGTGNLSSRFPGHDVTAKWADQRGFKRANGPFQDFDGHFCVSVAEYKAEMRETLKETIEDGDICYFKHDFVQVICSAEGHGHLPTRRHGFEANLDAILELMSWERQLKPDILCAPTSYAWPSPWWLMHVNYMWYGASDSGAVSTWPQPTNAEWEMNYHDGHLFRVYKNWRHMVPVSGFITHAFLRHAAPGVDPLREWTDYAMMVCGRGLRLMDLYLEPELPPDLWKALGKSLSWWQENIDVLGNTRMVGGNPRNGEVYGYAHWKGDRGILCLRNPDVAEQAIRVPFDKSVLYRGPDNKPFRGRVIYPYAEAMPTQFVSGCPILLRVPGYSVIVIELEPGEAPTLTPAAPVGLIEGRGSAISAPRDWTVAPNFYEDSSMSLTATVSVNLPDETMARCDLLLIARSNGALPEFPSITVNGSELDVPVVSGSGDTPSTMLFLRDTDPIHWSIHRIDLKEFRGRTAEIVAESSQNPVLFMLDAWLVADRPVGAAAVPHEKLPPAFWHNYRRQTVHLLSYRISITPLHH